MDRYAVIGSPVAHSLSPRIHAHFAALTQQSLTYEAIDVPAKELPHRLQLLHEEGFLGLNVTLPHKVAAGALCEQVSERARIAGATNTLVRTAAGWEGDNTDGEGLIHDLARLGFAVRGKRVLVLGAGGAARGVLQPLLEQQPAELVISNRNPWKPEELAAQFKSYGPIRPCTHFALKGDRFDLVLNATSAGHGGAIPRLPDGLIAPEAPCYDLSYGKAALPFRAWAERQGAERFADGLGMLVEQAAAAFERWRGVRPPTAPVLAELRSQAL